MFGRRTILMMWVLVSACGARQVGSLSKDAGPAMSDGADAGPVVSTGPGGVCQSTNIAPSSAKAPVDIIWVIDNSGSMDDEESYVKTNLNTFAQTIGASGIDYHVILITDASRVQIGPPLAGSPQFLAVNQNVGSSDAFEKVISTYPLWQQFLRPNASKQFVFVTDDESDMSAANFKSMLGALPPPGFSNGFTLHAIVAEVGALEVGINFAHPCFMKAAAKGEQYLQLQMQTGGLFSSLCQSNWTPIFTQLSTAIVAGTSLPCSFVIPPPPTGQSLDLNAVNLVYSGTTIPRVSAAASCGTGQGWYYDNPAMPTQVIACPTTCSALTMNATGSVELAFGCATLVL